MYLLPVLFAVAVLKGVLAIPPSYVLQVDHTCSETLDGESQVAVTTDLSVVVKVECEGKTIIVPTEDQVLFPFTARYQGDTAQYCVFKRRANSGIYVLLVIVAWSEPQETYKAKTEKYLVTCTLDPHAVNQTEEHDTDIGLLGPYELQERLGTESASTYMLQVTDIAGHPLTTNIDIGRKIQLRAYMTAVEGELGFRAVSCNAVAENMTYAVLRGGCGDGIVFPRECGFETTDFEISSPFFEAFKLRQNEYISFDCNFTACMAACNGDSCLHEGRRKRDAPSQDSLQVVTLSSNNVKIVEPEATEDVLDERKVKDLEKLGIDVIAKSCRMTSQGVECQANYGMIDTSQNDDFHSLLAVSLLLVQAVVSIGMIVAMVIAGRRSHMTDKFSASEKLAG